MNRFCLALCLLILGAVCAPVLADWHTSLYLNGGDYWNQRLPVTITNHLSRAAAGDPVTLPIGTAAGQANLVNARAEALRVCDAAGTEMLFLILDPNGMPLTRGAIPAGSTLILPAECASGASTTYYVYFDNPAAWVVPDFLNAPGVRNGGAELGSDTVAYEWNNDGGDAQHQALRASDQYHTGSWSFKTIVSPGAPSSWISTRQSNIAIQGGASYTLAGWVRAQSVIGDSGWYIHVGNAENGMMINQIASAGSGTFGWKQVSLTFTAPTDADRADLGTVLWGTGTAWFDDVTLTCNTPPLLSASAAQAEALQIYSAPETWYDDNPNDSFVWNYRVPVQVVNTSTTTSISALARVDITRLSLWLNGHLNLDSARIIGGSGLAAHYRVGNTLLFETQLPPQTAATYYLYLSADPGLPALPGADYAGLLASGHNLVQNPSFETGGAQPDDWPWYGPDTATHGLVSPGLFGAACAMNSIPHATTKSWTGWHQDVPVEPNKNYLFAAWAKCADVTDGSFRLYAHYRNAAGELCQTKQMTDAGPDISGTTDWTLMSGLFNMPPDIAYFQLHLTMNATGTAWHDGALLTEYVDSTLGAVQTKPRSNVRATLQVWPVNPLIKTFREDLPGVSTPAIIYAARNEKESLQLAVRSPDPINQANIVVDAPTGPGGFTLSTIKVGVVGYVPIDYPSSYFTSTASAWQRKLPSGSPGSDGWPGYWPDPILPTSTVNLHANRTQPIVITVSIPKDAPFGDYHGQVRIMTGTRKRATLPFTVHVWNFTLPDDTHLPAIYDVRLGSGDGQHQDWWQQTGKTALQVKQDVWKLLADNRLCADVIAPDPVFTTTNGVVTADFADFDAAAAYYLNTLHLPTFYAPWDFYCFGWNFPPGAKWGEAPYPGDYPYTGADRSQLRPEFKAAYQAHLQVFWDHLKTKGWANKCVLYISDEPFYTQPGIIEQMQALCAMVHAVDPNIPIYCSTWQYVPQWQGYLTVPGLGHSGQVPAATLNQLTSSGTRVRYTTDGQMCTDTPYLAFERLMPYYCFKYGVEAYEFWGSTWLTYNPYDFGWHSFIYQSDSPTNSYWVRYPNGDGYIIYPGGPVGSTLPVSSLRVEAARDGVEDYEYFYLLRNLIAQAKAAGKDTTAAENALSAALNIVTIPNAGGRFSSLILPDPAVVFTARQNIAAAIETLSASLSRRQLKKR
jgi:hypothetical protein